MLGPDGARLFRFELPPHEELAAASRTAVWTTWADELGVPFMRRYELVEDGHALAFAVPSRATR